MCAAKFIGKEGDYRFIILESDYFGYIRSAVRLLKCIRYAFSPAHLVYLCSINPLPLYLTMLMGVAVHIELPCLKFS